jgi:hypothetical protein
VSGKGRQDITVAVVDQMEPFLHRIDLLGNPEVTFRRPANSVRLPQAAINSGIVNRLPTTRCSARHPLKRQDFSVELQTIRL